MWGWELNCNAFRNAGMQKMFGMYSREGAVGVARDDLVGSGDARGGEARGDEGENGSGSDSARRGSKRCAGSAY